MIQANEIRINSWVSYTNDNGAFNLQVEEIRPTGIITAIWNGGSWFVSFDKLNPIPLTEEILIKAGFEKCRKGYSLNVGGESFDYYIKGEFVLWYHKNKGYSLDTISKSRDRFYNNVHELQNLFYCLCGEEITIKLD